MHIVSVVRQRVFLVAVLVALGMAAPYLVHAISNASIEAESGVKSGTAAPLTDPNASGGAGVVFNQQSSGTSCPAGQVGTPPNCQSATTALGVDARSTIAPFNKSMKGFGLGNWTFNFGSPYIGSVPNLTQIAAQIDPGIIRYAGGLKANYIGFDRTLRDPVFNSDWNYNGQTYAERYGTDELASLDTFAKAVGAKVMIQVNITNNDPSMWADLVRYAKEKGWTSFKYYEMGNELDLETSQNTGGKVDPTTYAARVKAYQQAMLAVDPTIKIVGGVPATATDIVVNNYASGGQVVSTYITKSLAAVRTSGTDLAAVSFHWYQGGADTTNAFNWTYNLKPADGEWWKESYARDWSGLVAPWIRSTALTAYPNTELGVSEINVDSGDNVPNNGNHVGALWFSDVLGRLAYTGTDWATEWDGYVGGISEYFGLFYGENGTTKVRPTYYAYLMYSKYFGDQMVKSSSFDDTKLSIWASKDSKDPGKLKLRITNLTGAAINAPVALGGFTASSGSAYVMSSTNPLDQSQNGTSQASGTSINGVKLNGASIASSVASIQPVNVPVSGTGFTYSIPAYSSAAIVLSGSF